jgi:hypothetical protein
MIVQIKINVHISLCMHFKMINKAVLRIYLGLKLTNLDFAWTGQLFSIPNELIDHLFIRYEHMRILQQPIDHFICYWDCNGYKQLVFIYIYIYIYIYIIQANPESKTTSKLLILNQYSYLCNQIFIVVHMSIHSHSHNT